MSRGEQEERGEATVLIVGFAVVLLLTVAVVIDASAAFLRHQSLDSLADGAALSGADAGAASASIYTGGLDDGTLDQSAARARDGVRAYLDGVGAYRTYPGLRVEVAVDGQHVTVHLTAPLHLPLSVPGSPDHPVVGATGSADETLDQAS